MLQVVDQQWKDHLLAIDHLKEGIGLRGYGQRDPLIEYKKESFELFTLMKERIEDQIVQYLFRLQPVSARRTPRTRRTPSERRPPVALPVAPRAGQRQLLLRRGGLRGPGREGRDGPAPASPRSAATIPAPAAPARSTRSATAPRAASPAPPAERAAARTATARRGPDGRSQDPGPLRRERGPARADLRRRPPPPGALRGPPARRRPAHAPDRARSG